MNGSLIAVFCLAIVALAAVAGVVVWMFRRASVAAEALRASLQESEKNLEVERELRQRGREDQERYMTATVNGAIEKFANMSHVQLAKNGDEFAAQNRKSMTDILNPLKEQLKAYDEALKAAQERGARSEAAMKEHVASLETAARKISSDAGSFIDNLTCSNKFQGDFGEDRLEYVLQCVGLAAGQDFVLQKGEGELIPDCQVFDHIGKKICVVDSKMSWKDYAAGFKSQDPAIRAEALAQHVKSIRKQIDNLSGKRYHARLTPPREGYAYLPFSIMFVPSDGALMTALEADPALPAYAVSKSVYLTSPLNLYNFLKLIEEGRPNFEISRNAERLAAEARHVVERIDKMFACIEDVGKFLDKAKECQQDALKLAATDEKGQCIKGPASKMIAMGVRIEKLKSKSMGEDQGE